MKHDYYDILKLNKNASSKEIQSAFRNMAMHHHPDRNNSPHAEERIKEIYEAYEVLRDPTKREQYDRVRNKNEEAELERIRFEEEKQKTEKERQEKIENLRKQKEEEERLKKLQEEKNRAEKKAIWDNSRQIVNIKTGYKTIENIQMEIVNRIEIRTNSIGMKFALIPAGEFMMGSEEFDNSKPIHKVKIGKPFYLGIYPVTQREWNEVMGSNNSEFKGDNLPVENITFGNGMDFIYKLSEKEGVDKYWFPSEEDWEYAARAGTTTKYSFGDDESKLGEYAWYNENSGIRPPKKVNTEWYFQDIEWDGKTHEVGKKKPNPWGIYDIHGNVCELVVDTMYDTQDGWWQYGDAIRGGSWCSTSKECQSANRVTCLGNTPDSTVGFRLLRKC